jgi:hypothetical protein
MKFFISTHKKNKVGWERSESSIKVYINFVAKNLLDLSEWNAMERDDNQKFNRGMKNFVDFIVREK